MYQQVSFNAADTGQKEILIALLSEEGYEGFEESAEGLNAFISQELFNAAVVENIAGIYGLSFTVEAIEKRNWNEEWERNFQPVIVDDFCTVRAAFHNIDVTTSYEIVITPKMSFGTGHHSTTFLMMRSMKEIDFSGRKVLDFGTGTGILAILAELLGAAEVNAVDNEEWAVINAKENCERNNCTKVKLWEGSLEVVPLQQYDIILANINRHILLHYMTQLADLLAAGGTILLSGILAEDEEMIVKAAAVAGLENTHRLELNNWIVLACVKN